MKVTTSMIEKFEIGACIKNKMNHCTYMCTLTLKDNQNRAVLISPNRISSLISEMPKDKIDSKVFTRPSKDLCGETNETFLSRIFTVKESDQEFKTFLLDMMKKSKVVQ